MAQGQNSLGYAGDFQAAEAWDLLKREPAAQLVDVRTTAEWNFVGMPDLAPVGREVLRVEWQRFPSMDLNPQFVAEVTHALEHEGVGCEAPILLLCRSGGRSRAAAMAMTQAGFSRAYNIAGGFEGDPDPERHRGNKNGWKAAGLPWRQT
ncbi:MAG TPA: rhodanese-like domain-containing protein [Rhizomicrobium sp.]|jgi:rhodanese-related sulfurtransferase